MLRRTHRRWRDAKGAALALARPRRVCVCVCVCVCDERPFPFAVPRMQTAEAILEFVGRCHEDSRSSIIAHKIMWGASLVGSLAGQARVLMHPVRSIVRWNRR